MKVPREVEIADNSSRSSQAPSKASGAVLQHLGPRSSIRRALSAWNFRYWLSSSIHSSHFMDLYGTVSRV